MSESVRRRLIGWTELVDVRGREIHATRDKDLPENLLLRPAFSEPTFTVEEDLLSVVLGIKVQMFEIGSAGAPDAQPLPEDQRAEVSCSYVAQLRLKEGHPAVDDALVQELVEDNLLFSLIPYFRESIQRHSQEIGLPPVVLPFMRRPLFPVPSAPKDE